MDMQAASTAPGRLHFVVEGLDCQNEVRALREAVGPIVGGEDKLSFDTIRGAMSVSRQDGATADMIIGAVAGTGMRATLSPQPDDVAADMSEEEPDPACGCSAAVQESLAPQSLAEQSGHIVYRIQGMDCAEEVTELKREVGPLVGQDKLAFDLLNGRMSISLMPDAELQNRIEKAVARAGLHAEPWDDTANDRAAQADGRRRRAQLWLTGASGAFTVLGFAVHALLAGGVIAAFEAGEQGMGSTPLASIAFYAVAVLVGARYVAPKAWLAARRMRPDMNLLMMIAVAGAIGIGAWFEAATVSFLFALALALEAWSLARARRAVAALMELAPSVARIRLADGAERDVLAKDVSIGAHIVIRPGDRIPLDGKVSAGESEVNQAPITGESVPIFKAAGDDIFAGTINGGGALDVVTTKIASESTLAHIIRMVGSAQSRRAPSEQWVEKFARVYTPVVMAFAIAVFLLPPLVLSENWAIWFYRALVLLVIACPCALVISTPVSIVAALAGAAKQGILIKGGLHLETPAKLKAIAMDKTGTLTQGQPEVIEIKAFDGYSESDLVRLAAALEARSEHPIGNAILARAAQLGIAAEPAEGVQAMVGRGIQGRVAGQAMWLGSRRYLEEQIEEQISDAVTVLQYVDVMSKAGRTVIAIGSGQEVFGLIAVADAVRPEARSIVNSLHNSGIRHVVMLTGDNRATAEAIAGLTGMDEVRAELLPGQKVDAVEDLMREYGSVAMVGDGINDAPAMARASLGIAMGAIGSDAAIETADIALMSDDLSKIAWLVRHSRATLATIRQNVGFSIAVKVLFAGLTVAGFASLWGAIAADVGASLLVVLNGLKLLNRDQAAR